jgi:hypothetical protein
MGNVFEWNKAKKLLEIYGDNWPECFTAQQISKLHFPNSDDSKILQNMLDTAVNLGEIGFNDILVTPSTLPSDYSGIGIAFEETTNQPYQKENAVTVSSAEWIAALMGFRIDDGKDVLIKNKLVNLCLLERFKNGLPKRWAYNWNLCGEECCCEATPLISRFSYAAWKDKPPIPQGGPLFYWLERECTQANPNQPKTAIEKKSKIQRELTKWMRETWIKEGMPEGTAFFDALKKYVNQPNSPIREHYTSSKNGPGIRWKTGSATNTMTIKAIQNKVSAFKQEPQ